MEKCNKTRGNMQYSEWINSPYYEKVAKNLSDSGRLLNEEVLDYIDQIPRKLNITSR
jgi:endonuclease I